MNGWGLKAEDTVWAVGIDGLPNSAGVDGTNGWFVVVQEG